MPQNSAIQSFYSHLKFFLLLIFLVMSLGLWWNNTENISITQNTLDKIYSKIEELDKKYSEIKIELENLRRNQIILSEKITDEKITAFSEKNISKENDNSSEKVLSSADKFSDSSLTNLSVAANIKNDLAADVKLEQQKDELIWQVQPNFPNLQIRTTLRQNNHLLALNVLGQNGSCKLNNLENPVNIIILLQDNKGNRHQLEQTWLPQNIVLPTLSTATKPIEICKNKNMIVLDANIPNIRLTGHLLLQQGHSTDIWGIENRTGQSLKISCHPSHIYQVTWRENIQEAFLPWKNENCTSKKIQLQIKLENSPMSFQENTYYQIIINTQSTNENIPIFYDWF